MNLKPLTKSPLPFALILIVLACWSCRDLETVEHTDEFGNIERYERRKSDFAKEGWYHRLEQNGAMIEAAQYHNDTLDGMRILFYENGDTSIVEHYRHGNFHGAYRMYYENGQLQQAGRYEDNLMQGSWVQYYESGQLKEDVLFVNGDENGPFTEYHENGQLATKGSYKDGDNEDGELLIYDEKGELIRRMNCVMGRCSTVWSAEKEAITTE